MKLRRHEYGPTVWTEGQKDYKEFFRKTSWNSLGPPDFGATESCLWTCGRTPWPRARLEARLLPNGAEMELKKGTVYIQASSGIRTSYPGVRDAEDSTSLKACRSVINSMALGRQQYVVFMGERSNWQCIALPGGLSYYGRIFHHS